MIVKDPCKIEEKKCQGEIILKKKGEKCVETIQNIKSLKWGSSHHHVKKYEKGKIKCVVMKNEKYMILDITVTSKIKQKKGVDSYANSKKYYVGEGEGWREILNPIGIRVDFDGDLRVNDHRVKYVVADNYNLELGEGDNWKCVEFSGKGELCDALEILGLDCKIKIGN